MNLGQNTTAFRMKLKLSQNDLVKIVGTSGDVIGRYERDEVKPPIDDVKRLADVLTTTVGFLLGETEDRELLKDPTMIKSLNDIAKFPEKDINHILYTIDAMINSVKLKSI
jgi:transcriptional regulator with XRE-family HTH domain